ncbi:(R,S)-reticuline 7-O-methyltransferase-like [Bidens hawaiensis]|uniref:(R,S)-reticuline 7-O-methyltransferase-like n=1 Tax=Bidens hawaiensis TaxID=980011 RepID=UPI0040490A95
MTNNTQNETNSNAMLRGQAQILQYLYGALDGMAIRCCVELRIADIIKNIGRPATLSEISTAIDSASINIDGLRRLMMFLVHRKVFDLIVQSDNPVYSLNYCSNWLLCDTNVTLAPLVMLRTNPITNLPLHVLSRSIKEGGTAFKATHGEELFDFCLLNSEFSKIFNEGMACTTKITMDAIISNYKDGFLGLKGSVVDVGGGIGTAIFEIVKAYPHLKGINFDLSHVLSTAPAYDGTITHVSGDMFKSIPPTETIFMKWILHDWNDDDCVKILENCRKALSKETGKLIIVDIVRQPVTHDVFDDMRLTYDLVMFAHFSGGRERTEPEWKKLLDEGGFGRYNIIKIPALQSIIEAFP